MGNFRTTLIQLSQDKVIDRVDLERLREVGAKVREDKKTAKSDDAWIAKQVLGYLDKFTDATNIRYGIPGQTLEFTLTPAYSESDRIPGDSVRAQLSYVSQSDNLPETDDDHQRCGAASLMNAYLLLGGDFFEASRRLGLDNSSELTYGNLHRAQEALFDAADSGGNGLSSSFSYTHRKGDIVSVTLNGEVTTALDKLGLKGEPLLGSTIKTMHDRTEAVKAFWEKSPEGVLLTGVYLDTATGALRSPGDNEAQNHFVTVFRDSAGHYLLDTGASDNGRGNSLHNLSPEQIDGFVNRTSGHVIGVSKR